MMSTAPPPRTARRSDRLVRIPLRAGGLRNRQHGNRERERRAEPHSCQTMSLHGLPPLVRPVQTDDTFVSARRGCQQRYRTHPVFHWDRFARRAGLRRNRLGSLGQLDRAAAAIQQERAGRAAPRHQGDGGARGAFIDLRLAQRGDRPAEEFAKAMAGSPVKLLSATRARRRSSDRRSTTPSPTRARCMAAAGTEISTPALTRVRVARPEARQ